MQKKEQALRMTLYLKHKELVSVDILKNYFDVIFALLKHKQPPRRTELSRTHDKLVNMTSTI